METQKEYWKHRNIERKKRHIKKHKDRKKMHTETEREINLRHIYNKKEIGLSMHMPLLPAVMLIIKTQI